MDPELAGLLSAVARATGRTPNVRDLTRFDNVYGLDRDAHDIGPDALLFTARLLDEHGAPVVRGVVLDRWTPPMVGGQGELVPEVDFYHDHRGLLFRCALAYLRNLPLALHGHTGVGKTELVRYFACLLGAPVYRMNLHGLSTTDDIIGKLLPVGDGGVVFQDGLVTTAVRSGGILLLEEMNATGQEVWFALHGLLDGSRALVLVEKDNEVVRQHAWCRIFSTFNPAEYPNLYPGTKELSAAYLRRWASVRIAFADLEVERAIILTRFPDFGAPETPRHPRDHARGGPGGTQAARRPQPGVRLRHEHGRPGGVGGPLAAGGPSGGGAHRLLRYPRAENARPSSATRSSPTSPTGT